MLVKAEIGAPHSLVLGSEFFSRLIASPRLKSPVCPTIYPELYTEIMNKSSLLTFLQLNFSKEYIK